MKTKNTFILLLITALTVGGYYYMVKVRKLETASERETKSKRLFDFKAADVNSIEIHSADNQMAFHKEGEKWLMTQPLQVRANSVELTGILSTLEYLEYTRKLTPGEIAEGKLTLADYGLEKPKYEATLKIPSQNIVLKIGNEPRQGDRVYILIGGDPNVYIVNKDIAGRLGKNLEDFRERALFEFTQDEVDHMEFKSAGKSMEFAKTNGQWKIVQPLLTRADSEHVENFLRDACDLRADSFLSEDPAKMKDYGLDDPVETSLRMDVKGQVHEVLFGKKVKDTDKIAAKIKGMNSIVSVPNTVLTEIQKPLNEFRDKRLARFDSSQVQSVSIKHRQSLTRLVREQSDWKIVEPESLQADPELVSNFLDQLSTLEVKDFIADVVPDPEKYALKNPVSVLTVYGADTNAPIASLELGGVDSKQKLQYVKIPSEPFVYGVPLDQVEMLPESSLSLRSRTLFEIPKESLVSCTYEKGKSSLTLVKNAEGKWTFDKNSKGVLNDTPWTKFLNQLEHFTVEKFEGTALNQNARQYGLDTPTATLKVNYQVNGTPKSEEIVVGRMVAKQPRHILWKNQRMVCEVSDEMWGVLSASWTTPQSK